MNRPPKRKQGRPPIIDEFTDIPMATNRRVILRRMRDGVCIDCRTPKADFSKSRCEPCRARYNERRHAAREKLIVNGLCVVCNKSKFKRDTGRACMVCVARKKKHDAAARRAALLAGLCGKCRKNSRTCGRLCRACRDAETKSNTERGRKLVSQGKCPYCKRPSVPGRRNCANCESMQQCRAHAAPLRIAPSEDALESLTAIFDL